MDINYELYKVLYHIAITPSFSEASKQLFVLQSAVSQFVKVPEEKLNQPLFIRSTKKIQLTPEGKTFLKHIEPAMNLIRRRENQLLEAHTLNGGQLRIGANDTICRYYLVPYLNRFHREFPDIHTKVTNQTSTKYARFLENGQADFIVTNYPNPALAGNMYTWVVDEFHDVSVVSRSVFPLEGRKFALEKLLDYPIMMLDRKSVTNEFPHQILRKSQSDLVPEIELPSSDLLIDLARIDPGIAFVPDFCIPIQDENLFIPNLKEQLPSCQMVVTHNESLPVFQAARQFMDILQQNTPDPSSPRMRLPPVPHYSG